MGDVLRFPVDPELRFPPPPPPPPDDDRARVDLPLPPPPPPSPPPECEDRSLRRKRGRSPEGAPLPPPPPLGFSRPGRLSDRLEGTAAPLRGGRRSASLTPRPMCRRLPPASPPRGGTRSESPAPRFIWRRLSPSPPRRSPSPPVPPKQPRLDDRVGRRSPPRGGRFEFDHGQGRGRGRVVRNTLHHAPGSKSGNGSDGIPADDEDYHNKRNSEFVLNDPNVPGGIPVMQQPAPEQLQRPSPTELTSRAFGGLGSCAAVPGARPLMPCHRSNLISLLVLTLLITGAAVTTAADEWPACKPISSRKCPPSSSPMYARQLSNSPSGTGGLPCNGSWTESELRQQCVPKGEISITNACCRIVLSTIDNQDKHCLCRVVQFYGLAVSDLGTAELWDIYQRCGGRGEIPRDTLHCDRGSHSPPPPSPLPPSPPHRKNPCGLPTWSIVVIAAAASIMALLVVLGVVVLIRKRLRSANEAAGGVQVPVGEGVPVGVAGGAVFDLFGRAAAVDPEAVALEQARLPPAAFEVPPPPPGFQPQGIPVVVVR